MNKILKIDAEYCFVGNLEDKSMIKVLVSNGYEGMSIGDYVDVFFDGQTHFIAKKEKNLSFESLVQQLPKFKKSTFDIGNLSFSSIPQIPWAEKIKQSYIWLAAGIFVSVIVVASLILTVIINGQIGLMLSDMFYDLSSFFDAIRVNPTVAVFLIIMSRFTLTLTTTSFFGNFSISASMFMPVILISLPIYIFSIGMIRRFIKQKNANISSINLFIDSTLSGFIALLIIALGLIIVSAMFSSDSVKVSYSFFTTTFRNIVIILIINGLFYFKEIVNEIEHGFIYALTRHILHKVAILVLFGSIMGLYIIVFVYKSPIAFLGLGNLAFLYPISAFGGEVVLNSSILMARGLSFFSTTQLPFVLFWVGIAFSSFVWFIDSNDLSIQYPSINPYIIDGLLGALTGVILWGLASLASISFSLSAFDSRMTLGLKTDATSFIVTALVLICLSVIRNIIGDKVEFLNQIKKNYHRVVERVFK